MPTSPALKAEIAANFDFLQRNLARLLPQHSGQFALLKNREVLGFFEDPFDADEAGKHAAGDGLYSIQQVTGQPVELGVYANTLL